MVALVNNSSEDKVLLALLENRILRILQQGFQFQIPTKDVYARPSGIVKKAYQKVSNQLYYDREVFLKHFREYIELAESTLKTQEAILRVGVAMASPEIIAERRSMIEHLKVYLYRFSSTKQFNEDIFAFFQDPILSKNIPSFPFPTDSEANT
jgi:hypothetical protein